MNWLYTVWYGYGWPSDKGNGPEAIMELVIIGAISALIVPPVRKWIKREFTKVHEKIEVGHSELHAKMDHIIKHSTDIPEFKEPK